MKEFFIEIIYALKELKFGAKLMGLTIALLCFIIDILHGLKNYWLFDVIRIIYFLIGVFSIIFMSNDFFIWLEQRKNNNEKQKELINTIKNI